MGTHMMLAGALIPHVHKKRGFGKPRPALDGQIARRCRQADFTGKCPTVRYDLDETNDTRGIMIRQLLAVFLSVILCLVRAGGQEKMPTLSASCSQVLDFDHPITSLPRGVQRKIRETLRPAIDSIIHDPGMGIDDVNSRDAKLYAIQILRDTEGNGLYAVSWQHPQFKVNSAIWIVEVKKNGTRNIGSFGGWGMHVFPGSNDGYPELMFAMKGYREGGGAEAQPACARKPGFTYTSVACPKQCADQLNSR